MLSLRCRLLQYAVFVGINGWHGNNIFSIFSVSCYGILLFKLFRRRNSSIARGKRLTMYNKAIIGFGFCDMQNYQCLGKSYLTRLRRDFIYRELITLTSTLIISHITKTSSNKCLICYSLLIKLCGNTT